jgi:two-component system response regulator AlgR
MDIVIVDDEPLARKRLCSMVTQCGYVVVAEAANGIEAIDAISAHDPEIVLLDIEMPGETGLEVAKKIAQLEAPPAIIFTTAYDQYALEAFDTAASSYLLKPVQQAQLEAALNKAKNITKLQLEFLKTEQTSSQRQHITSKGHRGIELIGLEDIRYFMADQKYVMVISVNGKVLIDETLKELEEEFSRQFIRAHRNSLVSIKHILGLDRDRQGHYSLRIADINEKPIVSRRYASKIKSLLKVL